MIGKYFKKYAYFSEVFIVDLAKLSGIELTINCILEDIDETFHLPPISRITIGDIFSILLLPIRILIYPVIGFQRARKWKNWASQPDNHTLFLKHAKFYTIDWKTRFTESKPKRWNTDY